MWGALLFFQVGYFSLFLSSQSCGMAGKTHVDVYGSRSIIVSSYLGSAVLWVRYMSVELPFLEGALVQKCSLLYCKYCVFVYWPYEFTVLRFVNICYCSIILVLCCRKIFVLWLQSHYHISHVSILLTECSYYIWSQFPYHITLSCCINTYMWNRFSSSDLCEEGQTGKPQFKNENVLLHSYHNTHLKHM